VNDTKDNVEVVHWHYIRDAALETLKRQAEREGGRILILPSEGSKEAGGLSSRTLDSSSDGKGMNNFGNDQRKGEKNASFRERLSQAILETDIEPTEAQKKAGNYKKGHLSFGGYNFTVENPRRSVRSGTDENGKKWSVVMHNTYGYLTGAGHLGKDGDHLDVFINDDADLDTFDGKIYIIDQVKPNDDESAKPEFDEHKIMWGFKSYPDAIRNYLLNYSRPWSGLGAITEVDKKTFDEWVQSSNRKMKPFAETRFGDNRDTAAKVVEAAVVQRDTEPSRIESSGGTAAHTTDRQTAAHSTGKKPETVVRWKPSELAEMSDKKIGNLISQLEQQKSMNNDLLERYQGKKRERLENGIAQADADIAQLKKEQERRAQRPDDDAMVMESSTPYGKVRSLKHGDLFGVSRPEYVEGDLFAVSPKTMSALEKKRKAIEGMSDAELLEGIGKESGKDILLEDISQQDCMEVYDRRHKVDYNAETDAYGKMLEESNTSLDDAYGMYSDVARQWTNGGATSDERMKLRAQLDVLENYIADKEAEE